jgi:hypothetical protein
MAKHPEKLAWSLFGAGSGLGGLLLASGCRGVCGACYGCIGTGVVLTAAALVRGRLAPATKGDAHGMATRID